MDDDMNDNDDWEPITAIRRLVEKDDLLHHGGIVAVAKILRG